MAFDLNWPHGHMTSDGRKARIICTDRDDGHVPPRCPIVALVGHYADDAAIYTSDGKDRSARPSWDLQNAPAPKRKVRVKGWMNVGIDGDASRVHAAREGADNSSFANYRIACIEIDREVEEGEGL